MNTIITIIMITAIIVLIFSIIDAFIVHIQPIHAIAIIFSVMIIAACAEYKNEPTAIDVYRGKTTLEVTYKDGIPVDSVVVFKNKKL